MTDATSRRALVISVALIITALAHPFADAATAAPDCPRGVIALTFDDGPGPSTAAVLDVLDRERAPGTFFVVGTNVDRRPQLVRRAAAAGHPIANHTMTHPFLGRLSTDRIVDEIRRADRAIQRTGVVPLRVLRPPYGSWDGPGGRVATAAASLGYRTVTWTVDPSDYRASTAQIRSRVLANLHPNANVLLHDGSRNAPEMVAALPGIISGARSRGYCLGVLDTAGRPVMPAANVATTTPVGHDTPLAGDFNGDGTTTIGVRRGDRYLLRNSNTGGPADLDFRYGRTNDIPIIGDFNGDGTTTIGVRRGDRYLLRNSNTGGPADLDFRYGRTNDIPIIGDFNGDGTTTIGVRGGDRYLLRNSNTGGPADLDFRYGR